MQAVISWSWFAMVLQQLETAADCNDNVREEVARLIYFISLSKHEIFSAFHCSENKSLLPAEKLSSSLYTQWVAYKYVKSVCG